MKTLEQQCMSAWNSGLTIDEAVARIGKSAIEAFTRYNAEYGDTCIPMHILHGYIPKPISDPKRLRHLGLIGSGHELKILIAASKVKA